MNGNFLSMSRLAAVELSAARTSQYLNSLPFTRANRSDGLTSLPKRSDSRRSRMASRKTSPKGMASAASPRSSLSRRFRGAQKKASPQKGRGTGIPCRIPISRRSRRQVLRTRWRTADRQNFRPRHHRSHGSRSSTKSSLHLRSETPSPLDANMRGFATPFVKIGDLSGASSVASRPPDVPAPNAGRDPCQLPSPALTTTRVSPPI